MKKLVRPVRKVNAEVVGLDVHEKSIVFTWMNRQGVELEQGSLVGTKEALTGFLDRLEAPTHVSFEAGRCTFWVYDILVERLGAAFVQASEPGT